MASPRLQISGPLEAGQSLLNSQNLPAPLTAALEYISARLAKKQITLSMIVVRRNTQSAGLSSPRSLASPGSPAMSPAKSIFSTVAKKSLSRSSSVSSISSYSSSTSTPSSPTESFRSSASGCRSPTSPNPYDMSLINTCTLTHKEEKTLRHYVSKAEKKFSIGYGSHSDPLIHNTN
jgi:hypothetical protein